MLHAENGTHGESEGDEETDDDLMDKISSSPSIDDGGYPLFLSPQKSGQAQCENGQAEDKALPLPQRQAQDFQNLVDTCANLQSLPPGHNSAHSCAASDKFKQDGGDPVSSP